MTPRRYLLSIALAFFAPLCLSGAEPKKLLLVGQGPDGHPATTHEFMAGLRVLEKCLKDVPGVEVLVVKAEEPWKEGPELMARADGVVLFLSQGARWVKQDPQRFTALQQVLKRGGGVAAFHWAIGAKDAVYIDAALDLWGGCHGGPDRKYQVLETDVRVADGAHPITAGVKDFRVKDEFYYTLKFAKPMERIHPILQARVDGDFHTVAWAWERPEGGRAFGFSGLHFHQNWERIEYRRLASQGVLWTLKVPVPKEGLPVKVSPEDLKLK